MMFGRSRRRRRSAVAEGIIDITSLIDAAFILIIFLLISTTFKRKEHAFTVTLPTASEEEVVVQVERNTVYVTKAGDLYFLRVDPDQGANAEAPPKEAEKLTEEELAKLLTTMAEKDPKAQISVLAQKDTDYQHIITVMSAASKAGIKQVQLPYEYASAPGGP